MEYFGLFVRVGQLLENVACLHVFIVLDGELEVVLLLRQLKLDIFLAESFFDELVVFFELECSFDAGLSCRLVFLLVFVLGLFARLRMLLLVVMSVLLTGFILVKLAPNFSIFLL